jgi:hypothetical protein
MSKITTWGAVSILLGSVAAGPLLADDGTDTAADTQSMESGMTSSQPTDADMNKEATTDDEINTGVTPSDTMEHQTSLENAKELVDKAGAALDLIKADPKGAKLLSNARGVLVVPYIVRENAVARFGAGLRMTGDVIRRDAVRVTAI